MHRKLSEINGIGPHTEASLKLHGYHDLQALASATVEDLLKVPGFGRVRAEAVLAIVREETEKAEENTSLPKEKKQKNKKKKDEKKRKKEEKKKKEDKKKGKKEKPTLKEKKKKKKKKK